MEIHLLSFLVLFFTINYLCAQSNNKLATASFLSLYLNENDKSSEYFYINVGLSLSRLCNMSKNDTVSIYLRNKTNIILLQRYIYWNYSQMNDTVLEFKISGYFELDSNFIKSNYYYSKCGGGLYFPNENIDNKSAVKHQHYKDTIEIPQEDLNYAMQHVYNESIGFIQCEANSELRFNHTSIIAGERMDYNKQYG